MLGSDDFQIFIEIGVNETAVSSNVVNVLLDDNRHTLTLDHHIGDDELEKRDIRSCSMSSSADELMLHRKFRFFIIRAQREIGKKLGIFCS